MDHLSLLKLAIRASIEAGEEILKVYDTNFEVEIKHDFTPVTKADKAASDSIIKSLSVSQIMVLSEEGDIYDYEIRKKNKYIWIVDPLDGTKEFVKRNGEFTVNIALVEGQRPIIGVIYSPVSRELYYGCVNQGSFKVSGHKILSQINDHKMNVDDLMAEAQKLPLHPHPQTYTVIASRSHLSKDISARIAKIKLHNPVNIINTGSSIKFCRIAEGLAHEYPRFGITMEWDTAAGQCIIEQTGGSVLDLGTNDIMKYNRETLQNNNFIAYCVNNNLERI
jgi:3'(2'), 5'-bisphosphate nucleotidase